MPFFSPIGGGGSGPVPDTVPATGYMSGLHISNNVADSDHDVDIAVGIARNDSDTDFINSQSIITVAIDALGENGLDTGVVAAELQYSIWIIQKPDLTQAGLFSLSDTSPTLPAGYTVKRRVGWIITDISSNVYGFTQTKMAGTVRKMTMDMFFSDAFFRIQTNGTAGTQTFTTRSAALIVPPTATQFVIRVTCQKNSGSNININIGVAPFGYGGDNWIIDCGVDDGDNIRIAEYFSLPVIDQSDRRVLYLVSPAAAALCTIIIHEYLDQL